MKCKLQILLVLLAMAALVAVSGLAWQAAGSQPPHRAAALHCTADFTQIYATSPCICRKTML